MTQPAPLLELCGVSHRFGTTVALDDAALAVRPGTIHALLGENGAGKTTLMRIAFGLVAPDSATVLVDGHRVTIHTPADAIGYGIGMVHQHFNLVPAMTVAENVALGGRGQLRLDAVRQALRTLSAASGLALDPDALVETLSVAEQQRVEIVKALSRDARVLILDEPTAVLAPAEADELLRWLRAYAARGNAAVLITHKLREATAAADDVTVLRRGKVVLHPRDRDAGTDAPTSAAIAAAMMGEVDSGGVGVGVGEADAGADAGADAVGGAVGGAVAPDVPPAHVPAPSMQPTSAPSSGAAVSRMDAVTVSRGRERISNATVTIAAGEVTGIAGIEGSGHHLLLLLLAGRLAPDSGAVTLPLDIGYIPEDRHRDAVAADRSLMENVALRGAGARRGAIRWGAWRERTDALVSRFDVRGPNDGGSMAARPVQVLSGGNQQKLVVARELGDAPRLVVAENPTRGLDVRAAGAVRERLREAARSGAAVVVYTPDLDEVLAIADRILVVHDGAVTECAGDREAVGRAMLGLA